jgi:all-trans-retinol 13,14-reductase
MKRYDCIVVGSGVSGLTLAQLLGMTGKSVLLIEKSPRIGGSLSRFHRQGIPFDTGLHFTGGLAAPGQKLRGSQILTDMVSILGFEDRIEPIFFTGENDNRIFLESEDLLFNVTTGYEKTIARHKEYFPREKQGIDKYFAMIKKVCEHTITLDLRDISFSQHTMEEDYVSVSAVIDQLIKDPKLKTILCAFSMCYGVKPAEISFADHSRICYSLYESLAYIKQGGDAFIKAFNSKLAQYPVDIRCNTHITEFGNIDKKHVGHFILNNGEEIQSDHCIFTIHPAEILKILPRKHFRKAFFHRVGSFEDSAGFFTLYGTIKDNTPQKSTPAMTSLFPICDLDQLLSPDYIGNQALMVMHHQETIKNKPHTIFQALELSYPEHTKKWAQSRSGKRPDEYYAYKRKQTENICQRIFTIHPEWKDSLNIIDSASILTHRDYLNSPHGSAYGIKQKVGQFNLFGRLPLRNLYAAGQNALLPGIIGAMMSSFILCRLITGKDDYSNFIRGRLDS